MKPRISRETRQLKAEIEAAKAKAEEAAFKAKADSKDWEMTDEEIDDAYQQLRDRDIADF